MSYDAAQAVEALRAIRDGRASPDARAQLEFYLLDQLQELGAAGFGKFLCDLPGVTFTRVSDDSAPHHQRYVDSSADPEMAIVYAAPADGASAEAFTFIDIRLAGELDLEAPTNPTHQVFYGTWDEVGLLDEPPLAAEPWRHAVYLVGLLEAQLMNGGFGQYLTNTDGRYVAATLTCLAEIGADLTHALLQRAVGIASDFPTFVEAWDVRPEGFASLDSEFLAAGEDLAGRCYDRFYPRGHAT